MTRKPYPSDVSDGEWALVAPYLAPLPEDAGQRRWPPLRESFNGLRYVVKTSAPWRSMPNDLPPWEVVYQQAQRWLAGRVGSRRWCTIRGCCCGSSAAASLSQPGW